MSAATATVASVSPQQPYDVVEVDVPGIGTLRNPVRRVGRPAPVESEVAS